ncbi:hypothetical protein [Saccharicrinis sp. GN24d3]|uniref:hypothetical protein n=1 Tax=Saccharicrinis sp. GN24d3 TaxID=3458416 RepID=UPI004035FF45
MDISGTYKYTEDFEYGNSEGTVELYQTNKEVSGVFTFTETVKNTYKIEVNEKVKGTISGNKLLLESVEVRAIQDGKAIEYLPNTFEIQHISENKLVGSTFDTEDICGVFVLDKIQK